MTTGMKAFKTRVFEMLSKAEDDDRFSKAIDWFIIALIILSIVSIIMESFAELYVEHRLVFQVIEYITIAVFSAEYLLRIWTADLLYPDARHPRLKYIFSFMAVIDLLSILPFYMPFISSSFRFLRLFRLFRILRLLRIFKLGRYFEALQIIVKVIRDSGPQLIMSMVICFFVMLFSAAVMYTVENQVQPNQFSNVISSLWWAMCTLTTVGYGDVYPITDVGKFFASVISLVGIGIIAIPTGIIAAGFAEGIRKNQDTGAEDGQAVSEKTLDGMSEEELAALQARISRRLREFGYTITVTVSGNRRKR